MPMFRKRPVEIEAMHWNGSQGWAQAIEEWSAGAAVFDLSRRSGVTLTIDTLEGTLTVSPGDWIIRGVKGEFYPCKPDVFEQSYEPVLGSES